MTNTNLIKLRKLAEAATPGPWVFGTFDRLLVVPVVDGDPDKHCAIADMGEGAIPWDATSNSKQEYEDAAYIAAANPATGIELLDTIEAQAKQIEALQAENAANARLFLEDLKKVEEERNALQADAECHLNNLRNAANLFLSYRNGYTSDELASAAIESMNRYIDASRKGNV